MSAMEVASGVRSTLNPNAPLFIPAAYRQVEDFSPEWWELVKTSTWFHDYWVKQHAEDESCGGNDDEDDIVNLLPDSFDACLCDEIPNLENQLEQAIWSATNEGKGMPLSGNQNVNSETLIKSLNLKSPRGGEAKPLPEPLKYRGRPTLNHASPRRIQQPR